MGNKFSKKNRDGSRIGNSGEAEASDVRSRTVDVYFPDGQKRAKNIYETETAVEFLETCLGETSEKYDVVLHFPLDRTQVLTANGEFSNYWDEIHYIKIVPQGSGVNRPAQSQDLDSAIHIRH